MLLVLAIAYSKPIVAADGKPVITLERGLCAGCLQYDLRVF